MLLKDLKKLVPYLERGGEFFPLYVVGFIVEQDDRAKVRSIADEELLREFVELFPEGKQVLRDHLERMLACLNPPDDQPTGGRIERFCLEE